MVEWLSLPGILKLVENLGEKKLLSLILIEILKNYRYYLVSLVTNIS